MKNFIRLFTASLVLIAVFIALPQPSFSALPSTAPDDPHENSSADRFVSGMTPIPADVLSRADDMISAGEFLSLLCRSVGATLPAREPNEDRTIPAVKYARYNEWLTYEEYFPVLRDPSTPIALETALKTLLRSMGAMCPTEAYAQGENAKSCALKNQIYEENIISFYRAYLLSGITAGSTSVSSEFLTRGQAVQLLASAATLKTAEVPAIPILQEFDVTYTGPEEARVYYLSQLAYCLLRFPTSVREKIKDENFTFVLTNDLTHPKAEKRGLQINGLYDLRSRSITVDIDQQEDITRLLAHEISHFIWQHMVTNSDKIAIARLYRNSPDERQGLVSATGSTYCLTDPWEYFAELSADLVINCAPEYPTNHTPHSQTEANALNLAPQSAEIALRYLLADAAA